MPVLGVFDHGLLDVFATGRLSPSCEQLLVDSDTPFPVATVSTWSASLLSRRSFFHAHGGHLQFLPRLSQA